MMMHHRHTTTKGLLVMTSSSFLIDHNVQYPVLYAIELFHSDAIGKVNLKLRSRQPFSILENARVGKYR